MAKVNSFMFSSGSSQEITPQGPIMHIINPLQIIVAPYIPGIFTFCLSFGITDFDYTKSHSIDVDLISPNGQKTIPTISGSIPPIPENKDVDIPENQHGFMSSLSFQNVDLKTIGTYTAILNFDKINIGEYEIYITRKKEEK